MLIDFRWVKPNLPITGMWVLPPHSLPMNSTQVWKLLMEYKGHTLFSTSTQNVNPIFNKKPEDATVKNRNQIRLVRPILS